MASRVGDTSQVIPLFPADQLQDRRLNELISSHIGLPETPYQGQGISYVPTAFLQAVLPYRQPTGKTVWFRTNGCVSMVVTAGSRVVNETTPDGRTISEVRSCGLPFGSLPRLLLNWLCTQAIITKSRRIQLGENLRDFMDRLGCNHKTTGVNGTVTRTMDQAVRLFSCTISLVRNNQGPQDKTLSGMPGRPIVDHCQVLVDGRDPTLLAGSYVELSDWFFREVTQHGAPVDINAVIKLRHSALALDICSWLAWRFSFTNSPTLVTWEALHHHFGAQCADVRKFRQTFRFALDHVLDVYSGARVEHRGNAAGIVLLPSPSLVARNALAR